MVWSEEAIKEVYDKLEEIINEAKKIVITGYASAKNVQEKSASYDLVTEFDKRTENYLIEHIHRAYPTHQFIAEETQPDAELSHEPTWIIDPIDGTTNFVHCFPHSAISVAFAINKEIVIGIVSNPMLDQTFSARKGHGAFLNGKPIKVSDTEELRDAVVGLEISQASNPEYLEKFVKRYRSCVSQTQGMRCLGSAQLSLCMVAQGSWDAYHVEHLFPWDMAAGSLIITEAGGVLRDTQRDQTFDVMKGRIITAGTAKLADSLIDVFNVA